MEGRAHDRITLERDPKAANVRALHFLNDDVDDPGKNMEMLMSVHVSESQSERFGLVELTSNLRLDVSRLNPTRRPQAGELKRGSG